ncbi:MAG TPA: hypothetical protein VGK77_17130 [Candidatus Binatia bacterium]
MTELEADDALASAAQIASVNEGVEKVCIWTPDKDLAQCVRGCKTVCGTPITAPNGRSSPLLKRRRP